jgi:hypothetical protein
MPKLGIRTREIHSIAKAMSLVPSSGIFKIWTARTVITPGIELRVDNQMPVTSAKMFTYSDNTNYNLNNFNVSI